MKKWILIAVFSLAAAVWAWRLLPRGGLTEADLRQTDGVTAEVVDVRYVPRGVEVRCRVSNSTARVAMHVVLNAAIVDAEGQVLAANPLSSISNVEGGESRDAAFLVPFSAIPAGARGTVDVSLVRWSDPRPGSGRKL